MAFVLLGIVVLLVLGEVYAGDDAPELGATIDGEPAPEQLRLDSSDSDVRNVSVALALMALGVLVLTWLYWRHTGKAARRRSAAVPDLEAEPSQ